MTDKTRINRVVTRTGDTGTTGLADGTRLAKDSARVESLGCVDELNAAMGMLASLAPNHSALVADIQQRLFDLGAELALPGTKRITPEHVTQLETETEGRNRALPPLREFILPGGGQAGAWCHYCRTIARRTERQLVSLDHSEALNPATLQWINRLSDMLFVLARAINHHHGDAETFWQN